MLPSILWVGGVGESETEIEMVGYGPVMELTNVMIVVDFKIYSNNSAVVVELRRVPTWRTRSSDSPS